MTLRYQKSHDLFRRALEVIPQGIYGFKNPVITLPGESPYYAARASGARFWDVDDNEFIDYLCGYGPVVLGHAHREVEDAVGEANSRGVCWNQPGEEMVELAERMVELISVADWAVFGKNGVDMTPHTSSSRRWSWPAECRRWRRRPGPSGWPDSTPAGERS